MSSILNPDHRHLMAILRGVEPDDVKDIGLALVDAGITRIEVPLNSPQPLDSISILADTLKTDAMVGAGTVLTIRHVQAVQDVGGQFIVSPNTDIEVIKATRSRDMQSYPGVYTPTEAFAAIKAGANALKLFPAFKIGMDGVKAMKAVLPEDMPLYAVGGVDAGAFIEWRRAGCIGFGMGSSLYKPGDRADVVGQRAKSLVFAYDALLAL